MGNDICSGSLVRVQLLKLLDSFWQPVLVTIFFYLNFYNFSTFTNNIGHDLPFIFWEKIK